MKKHLLFLAAIFIITNCQLLTTNCYAQNYQWAKAMGGINYDYGNSITTDASGNVYTTGTFVGTADFDPGPGIYNLTAVSSEDIFVSKLDAFGNFIWAKSIGGSGNDQGRSIAVDGNGNVYTTGKFVLTADFDPGSDTFNLTSAVSGYDIFVSKLDASGNFIWAKQMGGTGADYAASIAIDGTGNIYTTGSFADTVDFDPGVGIFNLTSIGSSDIFISKLDASGNFLWAKAMGGTGSDNGASIAIDGNGNVYTTGIFQSTVDFDPGAGIFNLTSVSGSLDIFVNKLDISGNFIWAKTMGGSGEDKGFSIAVDISGNVHTTGSFDGVADFDPGVGTFNLTPGGFTDIFVSKLDPSGDFIWAKKMGGTSGDISTSITLDGDGNVYTAGLFQSTADFDPGTGTFDLTAINGEDIFISKLDASGNFIWAKQMGGSGYENASCIRVDGDGNVYTTGFFENTVDFDPDAGVFNITSAGSRDIFVHKMSQCNLTTSISSTDIICNGSNNGTATASPTGGSSPYSYLWSNGQTSASATGLTAGTYSVTVTDNSGCTAMASATISEPSQLFVFISGSSIVTCFGGSNGSLTASGSDGTSPYTFLWNTGATTNTITGLTAGTYSVTVTDANGCEASTTGTVNQPADLIPNAPDGNVSCFGACDGTTTAAPTGGTSPYSYSWSNGQTGATVTNLCAGSNHYLTVTDINSCSAILGFTVFEPQQLTVSVTPSQVCQGQCNGIASAAASGGVTPYSYMWNDPFIQTSQTASGLCMGAYNVSVTDNNGCTASSNFNISAYSAGQWNQKANFGGTARSGAVAFSIGTKGYVGLGSNNAVPTMDFWEYNPSSDSWTQKADFGGGVRDVSVGFSIASKGYVGTGTDGNSKKDFWEYDPSNNIWTQKADFGGAARYGAVGFSINGLGYIGTGWDGTNKKDFWEYDPSVDSWTQKTDFGGIARNAAVGFSIGSKGYIGTGYDQVTNKKDFWEYDQATDTWIQKNDFPGTARRAIAGFSIGNYGYAGTGWDGSNKVDFWEYNPSIDSWAQKADFIGVGRSSAVGFSIGPKGYIGLGSDGSGKNDFYEFDPASPLSVSVNQTNITCYGQCNGSASLTVNGGAAPYSYSWSNGQNGQTDSALCAGIYDVTVTDSNNCTVSSPQFSIGDAIPLNVFVSINDASCNGCQDGSAQIDSVTGGTPPYSFNWSNGQTGNGISGLLSGNYNVIIADSNACTLTYNFNINQPMQANINFTNDTTNVCAPYAVNFTNTSTGNYDFYWNVRNDYLDTTINADSISFLFEKGGYYQVELCAFDSMGNNVGCAMHDVMILGFSLQMSASSACPGDAVGFEVNQNNNGGGGNGESSYTWDFGDGSASSTGGDKNLHTYDSPGAYTITVIGDHPQCGPDTVSTSLLVTDTVMPTVYYFTNNWNSCPNDIITFFPYNASGVYTWDFGDGSPLVSNQLFETEHGFSDTGTYIVTVSVTNSCGNSDSYSDTVYIQNNLGFYDQNFSNYSISPNPVCPGDLVQFRYEYPDNFETYIWNFGDGNSDTNNLQAYHSFATAGTYIASITIVNGCGYDTTLFDTISVQNNVAINSGDYQFFPIPLATCPGDSVLFLAEDGAQSYMWHFGDGDSAVPYGIGSGDITAYNHAFADTGTYYASLTITNGCGNSLTDTFPLPIVVSADVVPAINPLMGQAFGMLGSGTNETQPVCVPDSFIALTGGSLFHWDFGDGSPGVTTANIIVAHTYIYTGSYTVSLIAENSCGNSDTFSVMLNVGGVCPSPSVTVTGNDPTCFNSNNGNALASASGGTAPYSYQWSNGKTTALNGNLLAGTYSVTVTDVNGMTATGSITLSAPPAIILSMSANPASCGMSNGLASVTASGGATPYTYLWSNGQTSSIASNLAAGQYSVTVTAANGCKAVGSAMVNASSGFTATFTGTNITCNGASNGSAVISASGGTSPYSYSWSSGAASASLSGLAAGTYNATVTDNTGCTITGSVQVSQPPVLALILNGTNVSSCGGNNGSVNLTVFGGVSPYTYLWSNNAATEDISGLPAGIYTVTVTDANNCTKTKSVHITAPSSASLSFTKTNASCNSSCNGSASVAVNGGVSPYFYNWSNGAVNSTASGLCAGTYSVSVVDSAGCAVSGSVTIAQPTALTINASSAPANCGLATGNAVADCDGGIPPYIYQWSSGDVDTSYLSSSVDSLMAGLYLVTGTDSNGCSVYVSVQVSDFGAPAINLNLGVAVSCYGGSDGEIDITVTGTGTPFTYQWSNGAISQDINNLVAGPYEVTVTNSNGCIAVESFNLPQPEALSLSVSVNNATCGNADGDAAATVSGGWTPYTYDWSNGGSAAQISNLPSQIYSLTVTDDNGCTAVSSAAVGEEGGPLVTLDSITAANCAGAGSIYVSISDGVPPYTYNWDNGSVNEDLVGVLTGNYGLLVTDANGCTGAVSAQIINTQIITDPICLLTVDTATGTNKIVWQKTFGNGISAYKIYRESSFAGVYQLAGTIPFDNLSVFTDSAANPLQHSWRYKLAAVDSCGNESIISAAHKTMHVTVNLGIGNMINLIWDHYEGFSFGTYYIYRYKPLTGWVVQDSLASNLTSWSDLNPPSSFAGLRYYVEARHPDGCFATKSVENHNSSRSNKTYPLAPPAANLTATSSFSNEDGSCNGSATVTPSGGVSPYMYLWSNGDTTSAVDSLCAGSYSCTITDVDGDTAIVNVTVLLVNIARIGEEEISMIIYPNPNDGTFAVRCKVENKRCMEGKIVIYNLLGEVVCQSLITDHQSPYTVDLSAHGSGLYYLQLITEKGNSVPLKIVVQ